MTCIGENEAICDYCGRLLRRDSEKLIEIIDPISGHVWHACGRCPKSLEAIHVIWIAARILGGGKR